jgi:hypothetical protein
VKTRLALALAATGVLAIASVDAQQMTAVAPTPVPQAGGGGGRGGMVIAGAVETKITPNRPYSAEAVTETVQVMADGNRIQRSSMVKVYRDNAGRTRREMFGAGTTPQTISISDPVAKNGFTMHPEKKIAYQTSGNVVTPMTVPPSGASTAVARGGDGGGGRGGYASTTNPSAAPVLPAVTVTPGEVRERTAAVEDPNIKTEDLGVQNMEGVLAAGKRTTTTIPAGKIGNAKDIQVVSEQWFSDELQVLVMTRHSDPRSGDTTYRLRNILRAEPDPALFAVPADYQIVPRVIRRPQ